MRLSTLPIRVILTVFTWACALLIKLSGKLPGLIADTLLLMALAVLTYSMKNALMLKPGVHKTVLKAKLIWASGWQGWQQKRKMIHILCVNYLPLSFLWLKSYVVDAKGTDIG